MWFSSGTRTSFQSSRENDPSITSFVILTWINLSENTKNSQYGQFGQSHGPKMLHENSWNSSDMFNEGIRETDPAKCGSRKSVWESNRMVRGLLFPGCQETLPSFNQKRIRVRELSPPFESYRDSRCRAYHRWEVKIRWPLGPAALRRGKNVKATFSEHNPHLVYHILWEEILHSGWARSLDPAYVHGFRYCVTKNSLRCSRSSLSLFNECP